MIDEYAVIAFTGSQDMVVDRGSKEGIFQFPKPWNKPSRVSAFTPAVDTLTDKSSEKADMSWTTTNRETKT